MHREFSVGDHAYLRVRPRKSSLKLGSFSKMSPRYIGPFELFQRIGPVAYRLTFPASTRAHKAIHVYFLEKYVHDPNHVINWDLIQVELEGEFQTEPLCILDKKVIVLWNRVIGEVKVQWKHYGPNEATWELEDAMQLAHPFLFNFVKH